MRIRELVRVADRLRLRNNAGASLDTGPERSVVEVTGWVDIVLRERGKIVATRHAKNVWTNTGREYLSQLMSLQIGGTTYRNDAVAYFGAGTGMQLEEPGVTKLVTPIEYDQGLFLADIQSINFPLYPVRTTVAYKRVYAENEISMVPGVTVMVSEFGLYTNGDPSNLPVAYAFNTRNRSYDVSKDAAPVAYKTFEPVGKTPAMQLEVSWEIRF